MTQVFKDHFSQVAAAYRSYRPEYPEELFGWLAQVAPQRGAALDAGCGTGQAAVALARHFARVYAVDPSAEQIANAVAADNVSYLVAPAEATGLPPESQDLIIAAQALHWFDFDRFYPELRRLARPDAVFAAFTYGLLTVTPQLDAVIGRFYREIVGAYWPPERRHVDAGYRSLPFPFEEIAAPAFVMTASWPLEHLVGYFATWSAVKEYKKQKGSDPVALIRGELAAAWGDAEVREVTWPLVIRAGRIG